MQNQAVYPHPQCPEAASGDRPLDHNITISCTSDDRRTSIQPPSNHHPCFAQRGTIKKLQNKSNKRRRTVFRKINELQLCGARVYLLVEMHQKRYIYNSEEPNLWPPPLDKIVRN